MKPSTLIGLAVLVIGGYYFYENYLATPTAVPSGATTTPGTTTASGGATNVNSGGAITTQTTPTTAASANVTAAALYSKANTSGAASADAWDYYYTQITGVAPSGSQFDAMFGPIGSASRTRTYTADEYLAIMNQNGFHGLGLVANYNPYSLYGKPGMHGLRGLGGTIQAGRMETQLSKWLM